MNVIAGTESKACALQALDVFKKYNAECAKRGIASETIIRSSVVDNPEYSAHIEGVVEPSAEDEADKILSMVDLDECNQMVRLGWSLQKQTASSKSYYVTTCSA